MQIKLKKLFANPYSQVITFLVGSLFILITTLSVVLYNNGPRVRSVAFENDPSVVSVVENSVATIRFDRPLMDADYSQQIQFSPALAFSAQTAGQNILISFQENFQRGTEYTLEIGPDIHDQTGNAMRGSYQQTIRSAQPAYVYLERNYGNAFPDSIVITRDADDHIKSAVVGSNAEPEILFSDPEITLFTANRDYIVVATKGQDSDQLYTVDVHRGTVRQEELLFGGRVNNLTLSLRGQTALFSVTPDFESVSQEYYDAFSNRVVSLDTETGKMRSLTQEDGTYVRAFSIQIDRDGQAALVQDPTQSFYAVSPFNDYDPVLIGAFTESFGFNNTASEILFRKNTDFVMYNVSSGDTETISVTTSGEFVQLLRQRTGASYAGSLTYANSGSRSYVERVLAESDNAELLWSSDAVAQEALRDFTVSHDGSLLSLQLDPNNCISDQVAPNIQCTQTRTVIYDAIRQTEVTDVRGFNLLWLP